MLGEKNEVEGKEEIERTGNFQKIEVNVENKALARSIKYQARHISRQVIPAKQTAQ
jgi:hypothetical protein